MDRRNLLKGAALAGAGAAVGYVAGRSGPQIESEAQNAEATTGEAKKAGGVVLTMVQSWPRGFAVLDDAARYFADMVAQMSDGTLTIDRKAPGELVGALEVFDAVTSGQADMYHSADYYFIGQHPALAYYTAVPFGGTAQEVTNWYYHGGGEQIHDEIGKTFNFKGLLAGNSGGQSGGWFRKEMTSPDDFNGLKYRMPGLGGKVLGKLGASVQNIPGGELYQALSSGAGSIHSRSFTAPATRA